MSAAVAYSNWQAKLTSDLFGRMWFSKFRFDIANGNIATSIDSTLRSFVESKLKTIGGGPSPFAVLQSVVHENPTIFDLKGLRIPPDDEEYSLVVKLEVFAYFYLKRRVLLTILDDDDGELDFIWNNIDALTLRRFFEGRLRTDRAFFWCAPTKDIETICAKYTADRAATKLRDRLGLHLMGKGQRLVRIDVPLTALVGKRLRAPTTVDSEINPAFVPSEGKDSYGRTLNLMTIMRDVKETIAEEIQFDDTFNVQRVGIVLTEVPFISWAEVEALVT